MQSTSKWSYAFYNIKRGKNYRNVCFWHEVSFTNYCRIISIVFLHDNNIFSYPKALPITVYNMKLVFVHYVKFYPICLLSFLMNFIVLCTHSFNGHLTPFYFRYFLFSFPHIYWNIKWEVVPYRIASILQRYALHEKIRDRLKD